MTSQSAASDYRQNCEAERRFVASRVHDWLAALALAIVFIYGCATPARALSVTGISASANCDAVNLMSLSGAAGPATVRDGGGILIAWVGISGPFVPFEGPADNTQWTVNDGTTSISITPSAFASQCAPASLNVEVGNLNAVVVRGHAVKPPSKTYAVSNVGGSAIYQPATAYFPGGVAFFVLSGATTIGPFGSAGATLTFNATASHLAPGSYSATIAFSNAAKLSLVTTRQITLTVLANTPHDFNGDSKSDILWRNLNGGGGVAMWLMSGNTIQSVAGVGSLSMNWSIAGSRDMNGDGFGDILWYHSSGAVAVWLMNGATIISALGVGSLPISWSVVGTGDFNNDGVGDILWRDTGGSVAIWFLNNNGTLQASVGVGNVAINWQIVGTGDFDADGIRDILWREQTAGGIALWLMNSNGTIKSAIGLGSIQTAWTITATGDFDGDGVSDILWRHSSGAIAMWLMNSNGTIKSGAGLGSLPITDWTVAQTGDFDGDGKSDILWRHSSGAVALWLMSGGALASAQGVGFLTTDWQIQSANAD